MIGILLATAAASAQPASPDWRLLFRDPPQGAVYLDANSIWSHGDDRQITARFVFDHPRADEVAEMLTRFEANCATRAFRVRSIIRYDRAHRQIDSFALDDHGPVSGAIGPADRLVNAACRTPENRP